MPQLPNFPLLHFSPLCAVRVDKNFPPSAASYAHIRRLSKFPLCMHTFVRLLREETGYVRRIILRGANEI